MVLSWSRRRVFRRARKGKDVPGPAGASDLDVDVEVVVPTHFRCPITLDLMKDPVTLSTGITYDRDSIEKWVESGNQTCPVTNQSLISFDVIPNHAIRRMIQEWCVEHRSYGVERIPTPRIPVTQYEVSDICGKIMSATQRGDDNKCQQLVAKIKIWGRESERNKKCIVENGAAVALANAFSSFSSASIEKNVGLLDEILGLLTWILPKRQDGYSQIQAQSLLSSEASLSCMVWFLNSKDLSSRQNAALVLKQVPVEPLAKTEGMIEALVKMIKEPVGPSATKACLKAIFQMVSSSNEKERIIKRCVELSLVMLLLEALVDGDRGTSEKALGTLDCICDYGEGKEVAKANMLTLPIVVKKILRVSGLASDFGVSILWKLCDKMEETVVKEALQVGAFQKVLVLLQVGCGENTKGKATDLLKLLNAYKNTVECVDSSLDLKYLKKPF
ncbi:U-box domain-containing protein 21-like [Prosopis cineraria]|uniref:U-box domain-containing protein 21-like n=1 Tax=Prosopis cineraria TaxID=364024 RepID=UPI00240FF947|nr:U-box domain-containing protein 21-like [Prosopis cineraria]XP_054819733.1 U-box domain-containing protein 21-like [Prosopis cineraria]